MVRRSLSAGRCARPPLCWRPWAAKARSKTPPLGTKGPSVAASKHGLLRPAVPAARGEGVAPAPGRQSFRPASCGEALLECRSPRFGRSWCAARRRRVESRCGNKPLRHGAAEAPRCHESRQARLAGCVRRSFGASMGDIDEWRPLPMSGACVLVASPRVPAFVNYPFLFLGRADRANSRRPRHKGGTRHGLGRLGLARQRRGTSHLGGEPVCEPRAMGP